MALLGGKCSNCGWAGGLAAFEFHHQDGKDFSVGNAGNRSWDVIKKELLKCVLLCSNCHRETHSDYDNPALIEEVEKYKGRHLKR